jgi:hypothetical protein
MLPAASSHCDQQTKRWSVTSTNVTSHVYLSVTNEANYCMKMTVFGDVVPCSLVESDGRFRGVYCLHHVGEKHLLLVAVGTCCSFVMTHTSDSVRVAGVISAGVSVPVQIPSQAPDLTPNYWQRIQWSQLFGFPPPRLLVHQENPATTPASCPPMSAVATTANSIAASTLLLHQHATSSSVAQQVPRDGDHAAVGSDATRTHWSAQSFLPPSVG